jgi:hypothetical protein
MQNKLTETLFTILLMLELFAIPALMFLFGGTAI